MARTVLLNFIPALFVLLDTSRNGFSSATPVDKKELIDSIELQLIQNFDVCDRRSRAELSWTSMHGLIYAICNQRGDVRVFNATTYQRLDDIVVRRNDGYSRDHIASCPATKSLFLVDQELESHSNKMKVLKIDIESKSQSVWMTNWSESYVATFSRSPLDCRLVFTMSSSEGDILWAIRKQDPVTNTILVYNYDGSLVRTVPVPKEIKYPETVLETHSETYLLAEELTPDVPYLLKHLDSDGKMLPTLRRDDKINNEATGIGYDPVAMDFGPTGIIYAGGGRGEILAFNQEISRNRVLISSDFLTKILYEASTDRLLVYTPYERSVAAYDIRSSATTDE